MTRTKLILWIIWTAVVASIITTLWYKSKLKEDFWQAQVGVLKQEVAKIQVDNDALTWDIKQLRTEASRKEKIYMTNAETISWKNAKIDEIESAVYYLDKALWRNTAGNLSWDSK